ncbi:hypothetical protein B296_00016230 [Ensete ventricosum]|uniref:Uncharacterized protein n=1 Tax=Ensete ventricosum TaxID=4639 RepID=A0A426Z8C1_ENSVE|nr:hypothetical protein B296_00016230 [Ensete ventricosum]
MKSTRTPSLAGRKMKSYEASIGYTTSELGLGGYGPIPCSSFDSWTSFWTSSSRQVTWRSWARSESVESDDKVFDSGWLEWCDDKVFGRSVHVRGGWSGNRSPKARR